MDEAQVGAIPLVEAGENPTEVLELVDTTFDQMALAIQPGIVGAFHSGPLVGRNDRLTALFLKRRDESCGRIAAIGDHPREGEALQQRLRLSTIVALACR